MFPLRGRGHRVGNDAEKGGNRPTAKGEPPGLRQLAKGRRLWLARLSNRWLDGYAYADDGGRCWLQGTRIRPRELGDCRLLPGKPRVVRGMLRRR